MKCHICDVDKLSKEFWRENVSPDCLHPPVHCLQCIIDKFGGCTVDDAECPYKGCEARVERPKAVADECQAELDLLYPPIHSSPDDRLQQRNPSEAHKIVNVVMLNGDSATVPFNPQMTIEELKNEIKTKLKVEPDKQRLVYDEKILEEFTEDGNIACLQNFEVVANGTIQLMVLMYAIPSHFNHVIFDLFWGYPAHGRDYLDASCLVFCGKTLHTVIDFRGNKVSSAIWHSGDVMDHSKRRGHHTIEARLHEIPASVTHLYFTLSAWNSPTISHFPNPSLKFFEASNKSENLCETDFKKAHSSPAVIMCSVARQGSQWEIFECHRVSAGNAKNYNPIVSTIQGLTKI